jgi:hypothetical protein
MQGSATVDLIVNITASAIWAVVGAVTLQAVHLMRLARRRRRAGRFWSSFLDNTIIVLGLQSEEVTKDIEPSGLTGSGEIIALTYLTRQLEQIGASQVEIKLARDLEQDDWARNMIMIGGNDTNPAAVSIARRVAPDIRMSTDWRDQTLIDLRRDGSEDKLSIKQQDHHGSNSDLTLIDYGMIIYARNPDAPHRHVLIVSGGTGFGCQHAAWRCTTNNFLGTSLARQGRSLAETYRLDVVNRKPHLAHDVLTSALSEHA